MTASAATPLMADDARACVEQLARQAQRLYSLPAVALRVVRLTSQPMTDVRELAECLESDPALAARILAVVNSSVFCLRERVLDLNQAITLLGIKPLKLLVLGLSLPRDLTHVGKGELLARYWQYAIAKSVAAREISRRCFHRRMEDEAFITGLLQDLGVLVLLQHLEEPYVRLLRRTSELNGELLAWERESMGFNHIDVTVELLRQWGLPEQLLDQLALPPDPAAWQELSGDNVQLARILHLADLCARVVTGNRELLPGLQQWAAAHADAAPEVIGKLLYELEGKMRPLADALCVDVQHWPDMRVLIDAAYAALSVAAERAIPQLLDQQTREALAQQTAKWRSVPLNRHDTAAASPCTPTAHASAALSTVPLHSAPSGNATAGANGSPDRRLLEEIESSALWCRQQRRSLSLLLIDALIDQAPLPAPQGLYGLLRPALERHVDQRCTVVELSRARVALVLRDHGRQQALELARSMLDFLDRAPAPQFGAGLRASLSLGLACLNMVPRNFPGPDLQAAAQRCLFAAQHSGGGLVKSIDLI